MRIKKILFAVVLITVAVVTVVAKESTKESVFTNVEFCGTWISLDDPFLVTVTYNEDSTFVGNINIDGAIVWKYEGTWELKNNTVSYIYTFSSSNNIPVGTTDEDLILSIVSDTLTYQSAQGNVKRYARISQK